MNHSKFFIPFIIFTILIKFSTMAFKNAHSTFPAVKNITKIKNSPKHCSCHKKEALSKMTAVEFMRDGHKYLISTDPIGKGGTALVFHAIYFGQNWEMAVKSKTNCVAIKVANTNTNRNNNDRIANELEILNNIFQPNEEYSLWPKLSYNLNFLRSEIYSSIDESINFAIVMELGKLNLYEYWQNALAKICSKRCIFDTVLETILLYIMREISLGLHELHERNYIFIDLKPQNVMIMPNSTDPKELNDGNYGRLRIKLIDFGSALKIVPDEDGKQKLSDNETKNLMCTKFYLAPEIYKPINNKISPKTDIYSLGRLMLILAIQTPKMKKFTPQIKKIWKEWNVDENENCEENHNNWMQLVGSMLKAANIPPKIKNSDESYLDFWIIKEENKSESEDEEWEIKKITEEKEKNKIENEELKKIYEEMKGNYGYLIKIIEHINKQLLPTGLVLFLSGLIFVTTDFIVFANQFNLIDNRSNLN